MKTLEELSPTERCEMENYINEWRTDSYAVVYANGNCALLEPSKVREVLDGNKTPEEFGLVFMQQCTK